VVDVIVTLGKNTDYLIVKVSDRGPGIFPHDMKKLFQPYGCLKPGAGANPNEVGVGLYTCKKICLALGGDILCKSSRCRITTFKFYVKVEELPSQIFELTTDVKSCQNPRDTTYES